MTASQARQESHAGAFPPGEGGAYQEDREGELLPRSFYPFPLSICDPIGITRTKESMILTVCLERVEPSH